MEAWWPTRGQAIGTVACLSCVVWRCAYTARRRSNDELIPPRKSAAVVRTLNDDGQTPITTMLVPGRSIDNDTLQLDGPFEHQILANNASSGGTLPISPELPRLPGGPRCVDSRSSTCDKPMRRAAGEDGDSSAVACAVAQLQVRMMRPRAKASSV